MKAGRLVLWATVIGLYLAFGWIVGLVVVLWFVSRSLVKLSRTRAALAPVMRCPRGHEMHSHGVFHCAACGMTTESWVWRCPCGAWAGHIECDECGLSIKNPLA